MLFLENEEVAFPAVTRGMCIKRFGCFDLRCSNKYPQAWERQSWLKIDVNLTASAPIFFREIVNQCKNS